MSKLPLKDLQELVEADIITADTAQQITAWYAARQAHAPNKLNIVLGILGAILVGSGVVLLIAHNWDQFGKRLQTIFAFLPLLLAQALCLYTLIRKKDRTWQEASAVILFFAVPACISLISQVYHINGSMADFVLTWLLLMVPVIYLLNASVVSLLSIAGITWYAWLGDAGVDYPYMYVVLMLLIVPHYYRLARYNRESNFFHLHNWMLVVSITIALGAFIPHHYEVAWGFAGYMALFALLFLLGNSDYFKEYKLIASPALLIGLVGILVILMIFTYGFMWDTYRPRIVLSLFQEPYFYVMIICLLAGIALIIKNARQSSQWPHPVSIGAYIFCILAFTSLYKGPLASFLLNCTVLVIAIYYIRKGSIQNHLGILNFGLLIMAVLALLRFFDDSIPFIWRGIFFVATGIGFFAANYLLLKKRKALTQNQQA